ncbi:hypothetical protein SASPL_117058 [Salvia splendens]|uniref:EGF-like domain-containing protein n=1 Tax=Salvia splendens TaxID=180675 RepID=A0A8X8ZVY6_SALSN|nr:wall-associated receptor kinase 2-like [Salvia splendens]KAG6420527.1 hypothetical protein SASPL_117058 [Salvia splendens]
MQHSKSCATLASLGWEVEDINVSNHSLRRKDYNVQTFKAISHDYINRSLHLAPEAGQYMIRHSQNKFIIKACHVPAYLDLTLGVCASACNKQQYTCGASNLPGHQLLPNGSAKRYIRNCSLYVLGLGNSTDGCGFFTFIDSYSLSMHLNFSECSKKYTVPVVYECVVGNKSCKEGNICGDNSRCINSTTHTGYKCICTGGFQGNPYLRDGCKDIDECKESKRHRCLKNSRCINTEGSYYCLPNRRHMLALIIPLGIGLAVGVLILIGISLWMRRKLEMISDRKKKQRFFKRNGGLLLQQQVSSSLQEPTLFKIEGHR